MKKIATTLHILLLITLLVSCENLEPKIYGKQGEKNYPLNQQDITTMVTGVYGRMNLHSYLGLGDVSWQSRMIINTATTDEFVCFWVGEVWDVYRRFLWTASSEHVTAKTFAPFLKIITECVNTMYYMDQVQIDPVLKKEYTHQLKAIMAFHAYTLYDFYGPLEIVTDPAITLNSTSSYIPGRSTKEQMLEFIRTNAREAADGLPVVYGIQDYGRITKGMPLMVLLKLAMHEKDWQEAVNISDEIINLGYYKLQDNYLSIFSVENEMNKEILFPITMDANTRYNNWLAHVLPDIYEEPQRLPIQKWGGYKVPWNMYEKYWDKTGQPPYTPIADNRLQAIWHVINTKDGPLNLKEVDESWAQMGAIPYKYPVDPNGRGEPQGNDIIIYRYADVLLLRAEALHNLSPLCDEAIRTLNQIRQRAGTTLVSAGDFQSKEEFDDFILDERFRELFMEGHRREDLIRHGKYLDEARKRGAVHYDETRLLFPLPQWVINQSGGKGQNPGY